jgi:hypothetical protein
MQDTATAILQIQQQIAELNRELDRLQKRSTSLWQTVYNAFIEEGNDEEIAELWSNRLSKIISDWVASRRSELGKKLVATGEMPPYTDCLNELLLATAPAGSSPPPLPEPTGPINDALGGFVPPVHGEPVLPVPQGLSPDAVAGPPKMQRVNVPKPFNAP